MAKSRNKYFLFRWLFAAIILILWGMAFSSIVPVAAIVMKNFTLFPALLMVNLTLIIVFLLTLGLGRFYCSICCPLGILQDIIAYLSEVVNKRKNSNKKRINLYLLRLFILGLSFALWCGGSIILFLLLDPYSNFGRLTGNFSCATIIVGSIIVVMGLFYHRFFCNTICPAGTLLGEISRFSLFHLGFNQKCVKCGRCAKSCPANCIDVEQGKIDNKLCLRCMKCFSVCPLPQCGLSFRKIEKSDINFSRRTFLKNSGIFFASLVAGGLLLKSGAIKLLAVMPKFKILPPGAKNMKSFSAKCTNCRLCVKNCPARIIVPANQINGVVSLDLSRGFCQYNCNKCGEVCPAGAIAKLSLDEKKRTKIASAKIDYENCVGCMKCVKVCPTKAITQRGKAPRLQGRKCIGCGACLHACKFSAIKIEELEEQLTI